MNILMVLATVVVAVVTAGTRDRRQADGCFWWETNNKCKDDNSDAAGGDASQTEKPATPVEETRTGVADSNRIANVGGDGSVGQGGPPAPNADDWAFCNGGIGRCVPYYLCQAGNIITDGAGLIDIRVGPNRQGDGTETTSNSECDQFLDVCCNGPETEPITPAPIPNTDQRCGVRNEEGVHTRILGFKENQAQFGEFPWMAAVLRKEHIEEKELNLYVCGGSLIHPRIVLTAAHCVYSKDAASLKVRLGEWDTQRTYELYPHIDRNIIYVTLHEDYRSGPLWNDFALLFLDAPADVAPNVGTICLPLGTENFDYSTCWATGWGRDEFGKKGNYQNVLKEVALPVVPKGTCEAALKTTRLGQYFRLHHSFLCAGGQQGLDTCKGDGGSPLVCEVAPNTYVQAGIVSWGIGCGENGIPGVYADVIAASNWIKTNADAGLSNLFDIKSENYWSKH